MKKILVKEAKRIRIEKEKERKKKEKNRRIAKKAK